MSEREKLIELINKGEQSMWGKSVGAIKMQREMLADYLLENGVIVPPVNVGDMIWVIYNKCVMPANVMAVYVDKIGGMFDLKILTEGLESTINKDYTFDTVYTIKEQAEKALQKRGI